MEEYPNNNAASWTTKLRNSISLKGHWEMCLPELHYMPSMFTIPTDQKIVVHYPISKGLGRDFILYQLGCTIQRNH
ncbi:hypothetical protein RvY_12330 [Ramazzottius varieornatus]|uniref:Uncharacterized protein n=1 Tax=Ramazzottius varieornatus TaxID=947166 RepID=A0A1D1VJ56_RAMVA|nr:hypothetical protein RvY_12330 [Ramazzottius varieornatus]